MKLFTNLSARVLSGSLSDESKLCFSASLAFMAVGITGWMVNRVSPGATLLEALMAVGGFYLLLGVISLNKTAPAQDEMAESIDSMPSMRSAA